MRRETGTGFIIDGSELMCPICLKWSRYCKVGFCYEKWREKVEKKIRV